MHTHLRPAVTLLVAFTLLLGLGYPLAMTGLAQVVAPGAANGSLISKGGQVVGSQLIGQAFTSDRYFWGRPSAAGEKGYDAANSSGSNLGPLSKKLAERMQGDIAILRKAGLTEIPADAVTASASGLDPHISLAYAAAQVRRVAAARNMPEPLLRAMLDRATEGPLLGVMGEARINVLRLNLMLDERSAGGSG